MSMSAEQNQRETRRRVSQEVINPIEKLFIALYRAIEAAGGELEEAKVLEAVGMPYPDQILQAAEQIGIKNHIFELGKSWQSTYRLIPGHERDLARLTYDHPQMVNALTRPQTDGSSNPNYSPR